MTSLAIISDIHGNLPALEAVMADMAMVSPDQVMVNGDIVGRGPQSRETLQVIAETGWPVVLGNHEEYWVNWARGEQPDDWEDSWWSPTRLPLSALEAHWIDWMAELPFQHVVCIPGAPEVLLVHGSPRRIDEGLYEHDDDQTVLEIVGGTPQPVIVGAHTHVLLDRQVGGYHVLNSGSVGAPFNGDPRAQYLLLHWNGAAWQAEFRRVPYDHEAVLSVWQGQVYWDEGVAARIFAHELATANHHFWHFVRYCQENHHPFNSMEAFKQYVEHGPEAHPG